MKKIIYITLGLIIFSSLTTSAQFWKKNNKKTEEVIEKKSSPTKVVTPPKAIKKDEVAQEPQIKNTESPKKDTKPKISKPTRKKSSFKKNKKNVSQPELDSGSIEQQFDYIITKSTGYKEFQLIRKSSILKVKSHALDSIKNLSKKLAESIKSTNQSQTIITQLENEVNRLKQEAENISVDVDSISFFGNPISKTAYNSILWSIIIGLILVLIIFVIRFKNSLSTSKGATNELEKIENEFESFRKKSLKKEQETMRKLQDQINKNTS